MASPQNTSKQVARDNHGRFVKGQCGNPGGRPAVVREVRSLARQYTEAAVLTLVSIAADRKAPAAARVSACAELLNRGHGRPETATAAADGEARELPGDFVPADGIGTAAVYEQLIFGLITSESALTTLNSAAAQAAAPANLVEGRAPALAPSPEPRPPPSPEPSAQPAEDRLASNTSVGPAGALEVPPTPVASPLDHPTTPSAEALHDLAGCPTGDALAAAQRAREAAAAAARAVNEERLEAENRRARAAAAERARRQCEEEAQW